MGRRFRIHVKSRRFGEKSFIHMLGWKELILEASALHLHSLAYRERFIKYHIHFDVFHCCFMLYTLQTKSYSRSLAANIFSFLLTTKKIEVNQQPPSEKYGAIFLDEVMVQQSRIHSIIRLKNSGSVYDDTATNYKMYSLTPLRKLLRL